MVSGRGRENPSFPLLGREMGNEIDASSDFEGSCRKVVFMLHVDLGSNKLIKLGIGVERSTGKISGYELSCLEHVSKNGPFQIHRGLLYKKT
jgi:hypothetical protein